MVHLNLNHFICCIILTARLIMSSHIRRLNKHLDCRQKGIPCNISNCSTQVMVVPRTDAPTGPEWDQQVLGVDMEEDGHVPIMNVSWRLQANAGVHSLSGSEIHIRDVATHQSMCVRYAFKIERELNPDNEKWTFSLDGVVVEPGHTYYVSVFNLPEPVNRDYRISKHVTIPGCQDVKIQKAQICLENGSLWEPHLTEAVSVDKTQNMMTITATFNMARFSERYQVVIYTAGFNYFNKTVSKENRTSLNVTFKNIPLWDLLQCNVTVLIKPFFIRCQNDCLCHKRIFNSCQYYSKPSSRTIIIKAIVGLVMFAGLLAYFLWRTYHKDHDDMISTSVKEMYEGVQVQERKRILIIYSLDHPLYKSIVLKLCAFLMVKCGAEVVLDLMDSTMVGVLGTVQWLDWRREQMKRTSDKILILCSPGVQAKWRAMCGHKQVLLREDVHSAVGDMLTPALSLMVPTFVRSASFQKYIVAYFEDVCCENDVPSPFNITVKYKLMKQFEELSFRILDIEKHRPGQVNLIAGLGEDEYFLCPSGRALREAIEAFSAYQQKYPHWFEDELIMVSELEIDNTEVLDDAKYISNNTHALVEDIQ